MEVAIELLDTQVFLGSGNRNGPVGDFLDSGITALCRTQRSIGLDLCAHSTTKVWTPRWAFLKKKSPL